MSHSDRSPLPPIWPELYEDMYFTAKRDLMEVNVKNAVGTALAEAMERIGKGETSIAVHLNPEEIASMQPPTFPSMRTLLIEQEKFRAGLSSGQVVVEPGTGRSPHFQAFGTYDPDFIPKTGAEFNINDISHFNLLPIVAKWRFDYLKSLASMRIIRTEEQLTQGRDELLHTLYHVSHWRSEGRRVYVLDQTLYTMLAHTELPAWPLDTLAFRARSFYIKLPRQAFQFAVPNAIGLLDIENVEGVLVTISDPSPDTGRQREIAMIVCGDGSSVMKGSGGANIAYVTAGLGPDGKMSDVRFQMGSDYATAEIGDDVSLRITVPRVILGLMLYMSSEHPDLEPVPPAARREIEGIQNPAKRRKAEKQNARVSKLGYIYVGKRVAQEQERIEREATAHAERQGRKLDHPVWVSGHWRNQPFGEGRQLRRAIWIRPFRRGPDFEESLRIRAARVQPAQHK